MGPRRTAAAALVLLALTAGKLRAEPSWTVKSPLIARKSTGRAAASALAVLAVAGVAFLGRRRR